VPSRCMRRDEQAEHCGSECDQREPARLLPEDAGAQGHGKQGLRGLDDLYKRDGKERQRDVRADRAEQKAVWTSVHPSRRTMRLLVESSDGDITIALARSCIVVSANTSTEI